MIVAGLRVDQDDLVALLAQRLAGLGAGVVELAGLADDDRPGADDQDRRRSSRRGIGARTIAERRRWCTRKVCPGGSRAAADRQRLSTATVEYRARGLQPRVLQRLARATLAVGNSPLAAEVGAGHDARPMSDQPRRSLLVPVLVAGVITLLVSLLRLYGELQEWSPTLFGKAAGGGMGLVGIAFLVPIFGFWFGRRLAANGKRPAHAGKACSGACSASACVFGVFALATKVVTDPACKPG